MPDFPIPRDGWRQLGAMYLIESGTCIASTVADRWHLPPRSYSSRWKGQGYENRVNCFVQGVQ
jgi:hypothetical protein